MDSKKELGARIRARREALGWSQVELARRMGTSQVNISRWEGGTVQIGIPVLTRLAEVLEKPLAWFLVPDPPAAGVPIRQRERRPVATVKKRRRKGA